MKLNNLDILYQVLDTPHDKHKGTTPGCSARLLLTILVFPLLYISYTERRHALKITHNCDHKQDIAMAKLGLWGSEVTCVGH